MQGASARRSSLPTTPSRLTPHRAHRLLGATCILLGTPDLDARPRSLESHGEPEHPALGAKNDASVTVSDFLGRIRYGVTNRIVHRANGLHSWGDKAVSVRLPLGK